MADFSKTFTNIWAIKHPNLRAIRLKVIYKDIFSNERRHRFGIGASPLCEVCGAVESVEHHLHLCPNAIRMWELYQRITGEKIDSLVDIILCSTNLESEIIKSTLLKALIQIDRSKSLPERALVAQCAFFLGLEARVNRRKADSIKDVITRILNLV